MRRLKYVLRSKIACFVVAGAVLVLFWGAAIYNIYQESQGSISDLSELWSYISEQGLMFLFGAWGFVSFLVSGFQAKKASEADRAERGRCGYDGADIGTGYEYGERDAGWSGRWCIWIYIYRIWYIWVSCWIFGKDK